MNANAILNHGRDLVGSGWCQGADARNAVGKEVRPWSSSARSWSVLGALVGSEGVGRLAIGAVPVGELGEAIVALGEATATHSLQAWNDAPERTKAEVLAAFDAALVLVAVTPFPMGRLVRRTA